MSHNIEWHTYPVSKPSKDIEKELNAYAKVATAGEGGHGLYRPIRTLPMICDSYDAAKEYIKDNDFGDYDQIAAMYRTLPEDVTSKTLEQLEVQFKQALRQYNEENLKIPAQDAKADFIGCKQCGSKISRKYIRSNFCPVCRADMRSATQHGQAEEDAAEGRCLAWQDQRRADKADEEKQRSHVARQDRVPHLREETYEH